MPTITLPNTFVDGSTATGPKVSQNFYDPKATPDTFEVVNGWLEDDNLPAGALIPREAVQRGAFTLAGTTGSTLNLDYFTDLFPDADTSGSTSSFLAIPGTGLSFYLPYDTTAILFTWMIAWCNDSDAAGDESVIRLFVDGTSVTGQRRVVGKTEDANIRYSDRRDRRWFGHHLVSAMGKGWHTVDLRILADAPQTRVRVRSMRYIAFQ